MNQTTKYLISLIEGISGEKLASNNQYLQYEQEYKQLWREFFEQQPEKVRDQVLRLTDLASYMEELSKVTSILTALQVGLDLRALDYSACYALQIEVRPLF